MSPAVRIQHYIPQFYLKQFAQKKGRNYYIKCFDKSKLKSFQVNTQKIACESYFFDPPGTNQPIEKWLAEIETRFAKAYYSLIEHQELKRLSASDCEAISIFLSVQWVRTREQREFLRDFITQITKRLEEKTGTDQIRDKLETWSQKDFIVSLQIEDMRVNVRDVAPIIQIMKWTLLVNNTKMPFWTSDNPFTCYNPVAPPQSMGNLGLLNIGIQVLFPLTPRLSLQVCDPVAYCHFPDIINVKLENAVFQNELQVDWSTRYLFSSNDDFSLAKRRIKRYPEAGRIDRQRVDAF